MTRLLTLKRRTAAWAAVAVCAFSVTGCFTGVESTPKITAREIKRQHAVETPESRLLADVQGQPPRLWHRGKPFYVTDSRIAVAMSREGTSLTAPDSLQGHVLRFDEVLHSPSITGTDEAVLAFVADRVPQRLLLRTGIAMDRFVEMDELPVPYTVEMSVVNDAAARMANNTYYILGARRFGSDGTERTGLRYIPVRITAVTPGTPSQPLMVRFTEPDGTAGAVLVGVGRTRTSLSSFDAMFAFSDPRQRYRDITPENWDRIQHSQVVLGMTPTECRLALGAPQNYQKIPTTAGMVEQWGYDNGRFLLFEDGRLTRFRE